MRLVPPLASALLTASLLASAVAARPALGQDSGGAPNRLCVFGRPAPDCASVLYLRASFSPHVAGSSAPYDHPDLVGREAPELESNYAVEVGFLRNRLDGGARGASLLVGADGNGARVALKGRYRWWLGRYAALDAGAGILAAQRSRPAARYPEPDAEAGVGLTADMVLGLTDWVSVGLEGDLLWTGADSPAHALYARVQLGTLPSLVAGVWGLVGLVAVGQSG